MHKEITQTGLNRVLWKLLAAVGGKITISDREINTINPDVGIHIEHNSAADTFTLSLRKIPAKKSPIILGLN